MLIWEEDTPASRTFLSEDGTSCTPRILTMRLSQNWPSGALVVALALIIPASACAQVVAEFGPRGEINDMRVGGVDYLKDIGLSLIKPGWAGRLADQRSLDPASVKVDKLPGETVYSANLGTEGCAIRMREVASVSPDRVTLDYEITPEKDVETEVVLVQGTLPAESHAGLTTTILAGETVSRSLCPAKLNPDSYVILGGQEAEWIGFTKARSASLRVVPGGSHVQFQDDRKWNMPGFSLMVMAAGGRLTAGEPVRISIVFEASSAEKIEAAARSLARTEIESLKLVDARPLSLRAPALDKNSVETFSTVELTADIAATYDNPFDPDQIAVDAEVTTPDGRTLNVPGFHEVPMRLETRRGSERLVPSGQPGFRVRYTPTSEGTHRLVLKAVDRTGAVRSSPLVLTVKAGRSPGFVRVAKPSPHYFAYDSGRPFVAIGENICWSSGRTPMADYTAWLKGLGAAGGNWARLWLAYNEKGLEWMPAPTPKPGTGAYLGLGRYSPGNAWRLDEVMRLARENGVYLMFCLGTYGEFTEGGYFNEGCWVSNPYNSRNGGPCAHPADFWTNGDARKLYQRRLRYLIARWGSYPNLFAWEFWNEVPATRPGNAWLAEMSAYLKRHDPNRHLVSTTYGDATTWKIRDIDFTMTHMYGQAGNTADFTQQIKRETRAGLAFNKPYLLAEFGIDWQTGDERWDRPRSGLNMHNGAWAALMSGAAGTAMLWYWDGYVHPSNCYHILTPVRKFADAVDWLHAPLRPVEGIHLEQGGDRGETFSDLTVPAAQEWGKAASSVYTVSRDGSVQGSPVAMTIGSPARGNPGELFTKLTWHLDLPSAGQVVARLGQVCSGATLQVLLDGKICLERKLSAGDAGKGPWKSAHRLEQWNVWVSDYDEDLVIDVPPGKHDLTFANTEGDWLQIRSLLLPGYRSSRYPQVDALGLASDAQLLLWFHNQESNWRTEYDHKHPGTLDSIRARVPAASGTWRVECWDTSRGEVLQSDKVTASHGELLLSLPDFSTDVAVRAVRDQAKAP